MKLISPVNIFVLHAELQKFVSSGRDYSCVLFHRMPTLAGEACNQLNL